MKWSAWRLLWKDVRVKCAVCTFGRRGPVTVPVVVVRGRQIVQFRLVPNKHVFGTGRSVVVAGAAYAWRGRAGTSTAATDGRRDTAAAERRFLLLLIVNGHVHAGHEADAGLLLLGLYPAAAASIPSAAGHQRGPPPDDNLLLPSNPSLRIDQSAIVMHTLRCLVYTTSRTHITQILYYY